MRLTRLTRVLLTAVGPILLGGMPAAAWPAEPRYLINISVDGLGASYLNALVNTNQAPNFRRLQVEGAWTNNARNDYDNTVTLPNHTTMVTARGVEGADGHNWTGDGTPPSGVTIESNKGYYVASIFDVVLDSGLPTAMFANKSKFSLFPTSYDKIDTYLYSHDSAPLLQSYCSAMGSAPFPYSFLHLRDPDDAGHASGWGTTPYNDSVKTIDGYLGTIFNLVETNPTLQGKTTIVLTADHGGKGTGHSTDTQPLNYTIPFYVWGPGVSRGADLYALNTSTRLDPGGDRPAYTASRQPVRNGDMGNLSLGLLGLGPIPGSTINYGQNLAVSGAAPALPILVACNYYLQQGENIGSWTPGPGDVELGFSTTSTPQGAASPLAAVYNSSTSPWRLRMQSVQAETTFASIDLTPYRGVSAAIDVMLKNVTYEGNDFFRVSVTNGIDTIPLAEAVGPALNGLAKSTWLHYAVVIPDSWTTAVLKVAGSTTSATSANAIDFDNIEFYAAVVSASWLPAGDEGWSDADNWSSDVPSHAGDTATFGPAAQSAAAVSLEGSRALGSLTFNNPSGYRLAGAPGDTLILANGLNNPVSVTVEGTAGRHEIAVPISLLSDLKVSTSAGTTLIISGSVTGNRALTKVGDGLLVLSGSNEYTGGTSIKAGTLSITVDCNLGASAGGLTLDGGTLRTTGASFASGRAVTLAAGGGTFDNADTLTLQGHQTWADNALATYAAGTTRYDLDNTKTVVVGTNVTATVAAGAILELSGSRSALSDGTHHVNVITDSGTSLLNVSGTGQAVGGIDGAGSTVIQPGADLTADYIHQDTLEILDNAVVTIRPHTTAGGAVPGAYASGQMNEVPEPATLVLVLSLGGAATMVWSCRRRRA